MDRDCAKAVKILFNAFSSKALAGRTLESVALDFEYAKSRGVMFENEVLDHDAVVSRALAARSGITKEAVANAFVVSLASRRLEMRSAIGSFAVLQHFPVHPAPPSDSRCPICGVFARRSTEELNVLNLERFKFGGVRHDQALYAALDLELFKRYNPVVPSDSDVRLLGGLVRAIDEAPLRTSSSRLEKYLSKVLSSNKSERDVLIGILGLCGIVCTADHKGYAERFIAYRDRELPSRRFVDMAYPACWWSTADGVNFKNVSYWFGHLSGWQTPR